MSNKISNATWDTIYHLWHDGDPDRATLSALRNTSNLNSPTAAHVWPTLLTAVPKEYLSRDGKPTYAENAIFTSLNIWARYQQSISDQLMANSKINGGMPIMSLLAATKKDADDAKDPVNDLQKLVTYQSTIITLKSLIFRIDKELKQPLDFGQLASDLYSFQFGYTAARQIQLKWGEQYYYAVAKKGKDTETTKK